MNDYIMPKLTVTLITALLLVISASTSADSAKREITLTVVDAHSKGNVTVSVYPRRAGIKFRLDHDYRVTIAVKPEMNVETEYISLNTDGNLVLSSGFSWNGANATIDTKTILRGSMVHDALYELMRNGLLDSSRWRKTADAELARICREDGMRKSRIVILNFLVSRFGERMIKASSIRMSFTKIDVGDDQ